ncbi:LptF/LptG family permease [Tuwongella immobilis]|uniref:Permease YjgP/YjgQ family protein n=1 Tax=Tuwongella immobilis TaxID=692036 RepID=A0A6C2YM31_9BACT|nr:LptF/LptG family permease [Tuwongella immobilis]VIP02417.1 permease family protein : Putative permease OS=Singulisphaera acidiphila (strain ATCC BAA-1392 / DSM 18658 / VKM B-2454 / MOB10) GN=Sinac_2240 PE=4 SV=1: YjgP_YjgQ [Tuwongella immobilis]VTS01336.1 permease family protein : Putative permease OS=Singulisphaera acidiphila (strain ATCC BAA-1392 / DSM 18658 / VKM B-2454 / MOB10) GN=Sinac_2240 PE=4 SV=1: YjgP_YjgQ [Tuwongella immobilis]
MTLLDRLLFTAYLRAYAICFVSLLSLYIIIDMFTNLDDFAQSGQGFVAMMIRIGQYYLYQSIQIFDRICEAIVLLAAVFTITWLQRNNELLPMLAAGISTHRVLRPILIGCGFMIALGSLNQEFLMPNIAEQLMAPRDDPQGDKQIGVRGAFDPNGIHIEGMAAVRRDYTVRYMYVTIPETVSNGMIHITAAEAAYIPPNGERLSGGWLLNHATPLELDNWNNPELLEVLEPGKFFVHTNDVDFDAITRNKNWYTLAATSKLYELLQRSDLQRTPALAVQFHMRLVRPLIGFVMVLFGLGLILRDQNRNMFISAGMCLGMAAGFYGLLFASRHLGEVDVIAPTLAAWLPALLFGPPAFILFDEIQT